MTGPGLAWLVATAAAFTLAPAALLRLLTHQIAKDHAADTEGHR